MPVVSSYARDSPYGTAITLIFPPREESYPYVNCIFQLGKGPAATLLHFEFGGLCYECGPTIIKGGRELSNANALLQQRRLGAKH